MCLKIHQRPSRLSSVGLTLLCVMCFGRLHAQNHTILFSVTDPGITTVITNWGVNTLSTADIQRDLTFMGSNAVNFVLVGFDANSPQTNNSLTSSQLTDLNNNISTAAMVPAARLVMSFNSGAGVDPWYQSGSGTIYPDRWATNMEVWQRYYAARVVNHPFWWTMPFNEPDYSGWGEGSAQNLHDIMGYLLASTNYANSIMAGGTTLNDDVALSWFDTISSRATIGTTHCLAGSASSYVNFIQSVSTSNAVPVNPEVHNLMEAIMGAQYGLKGVAWWGPALRARGGFATACQGQQLGYADDWNNWTAAAVYRGTNNAVQAFLGGSERMATTTSYRFFSRDRDVFYDGNGPQRGYTVIVPGGTGYQVNQPNAEQLINISWGADVQPAINGRYIIVNDNSHLALEVPGGSTVNGIQLDQNSYSGALYQQWDVKPLPGTFGGDVSYFSITAVHDGVTVDLNNFSFANGDQIQQWNGGTNEVEQWYFQYITNGYFKIRSRWSGKCVGVNGASKIAGSQIVQWDDDGSPDQQWRLIPATTSTYDFIAPAAPAGVTATANAVSMQVNWNANTESDLASYTVLRGTTNGGPYDIVARGLTNHVFTDKSANQPQTFYYVVQAVDRSLNTSSYSAQVSGTPGCGPTLLAQYHFDGNTSDTSGNANDATTTGSPAFVAGKYSSALNLTGASQYAMAPAGIMASVTNFTIAAWVNWAGGNAWQRIFDFGNNTTQYMFLTPGSGSGTLRFAISTNGNAPGAEQILETSPLPVGQWEHVAVTRNGTTARLYTNGVLAMSGTVTIPPASFNPALNNLGMSQYPADPFFNGQLDEIYIYNYALSANEIARLATNQPPPPTVPTPLSISVPSNSLLISWPSNYIGCTLQSNPVSLTATGSWFAVSESSSTNQISLPVSASASNVFYRLVYP